ncbi:MAG: alpha/beta hydrolase [Cellulosilyticaceae bacterium]
MKKTSKFFIGVGSALLLATTIALGYGANFFYNLALNPDTPKDLIFNPGGPTNVTTNDSNSKTPQLLFDGAPYTDLTLTSRDGLNLHHYFFEQPNSHKWAITVHGYTADGSAMSAFARRFRDMGYNVLIPDLRGHGSSEGDYIGMGWDERFDIIDLIDYIVMQDPAAEIVLFGISMGAATVMSTSGEPLPTNVKAIIEDCGYTSVWDEFAFQLNDLFDLPSFPMMHLSSLMTKIRAGYWLGEARPISQVEKSVTPMLFIHGDADTFVPYTMLEPLYNACSAPKEKLIIKGASHGNASTTDPELYWSTVANFLDKYIQ